MTKVRFGFQTSAGVSFIPNKLNEIMTVIQITHAAKILNMMKRLKEYSLGISFSAERFGGNILELVEKPIMDVLQSEDCSGIVAEIAAFNKQIYEKNIDAQSISDERQLKDIASILGSADNYLKQFYVKDKQKKYVIKEAQLIKIINIIRLYYAMLLAGRLHDVKWKMAENDNDLSRDFYEIGLLQGELNLIASLSDQEIIKIHHSTKSSRGGKKSWVDLDKIANEAAKEASKRYSEGTMVFHNKMARNIYTEFEKKRKYRKIIEKYNKRSGPNTVFSRILSEIKKVAPKGFIRGL